jgi:hypothetical protein
MPNRNPPASELLERLRQLHGGSCQHVGSKGLCGSKHKLEFAHLQPTGLQGRGRGSRARYLDIKRHPLAYALLCRQHHLLLDGPYGRSEPQQPAEKDPVPF